MTAIDEYFWVVDVEGNGASPPEVVELAMVEVSLRALSGKTYHWFIKPRLPINPRVTRIHGITNDDVSRAPSMEDIEDDVYLCLEHSPIVGHNVRIEVQALKRSLTDWSPVSAIDTLRLAKNLKPGLKSYSLKNLGAEFALSKQAALLSGRRHHSALYDATLTALLFVKLLEEVPPADHHRAIAEADILNRAQGILL